MSTPVVKVEQGWLRGATVKSVVGGSYVSFKGIPYAAPPVKELRFADPRPAIPWTGIREATKEGPKCPQSSILMPQESIGQEDCLYLNVATRSLTGPRPVMVWIHGGAFMMGDGGSDTYSPDYLMKSDIVYVSMNYRLGIFGFLQLDHEEVAGNMGLKDQVAALKWVKENIAQFGGDPNNVTIFGESAGSASVHYLLLSPLAKGLFHKAILQSGVAVNPWACCPMPPDTPHRLVAALGKETTDPNEILEYLREVPVYRLLEVQEELRSVQDKLILACPFRPYVDAKSRQPFMPKPPQELATEGVDVPILIGYNSHEGILFLTGINDESLPVVNDEFDATVTIDLKHLSPSKQEEVAKEIRKFYFGDKQITKETLEEIVKCYGETYFVSGILKVLQYQSQLSSPTYFYKFSHRSQKSFAEIVFKSPLQGTAHADDLPYLFYPALYGDSFNFEPNSTDRLVSDRFVKMWTDFAKTGNPTPEINDLITVKWEPVSKTTNNCLIIDAELSMTENPDDDVFQLFKRISEIIRSQ